MRDTIDYRRIVAKELQAKLKLPTRPDLNHLALIKAQLERERAGDIADSIYWLNEGPRRPPALSWSESIARNSTQNITEHRILAEYCKILKQIKRERHQQTVLLNKLRRMGVAGPEQLLKELYAPGNNLKLMREHLCSKLELRSYTSWAELVAFVVARFKAFDARQTDYQASHFLELTASAANLSRSKEAESLSK
jgi:hypothetical protein